MEVWLHVGVSKTGTSALQVALAKLRPKLADAGVWYPEAMSPETEQLAQNGQITSGNAVELGWFASESLMPRYPADRSVTFRWLRRVIAEAEGRTLLFSSEALQEPDPDKGAALAALLTEGGRLLRILYYVRHALDYCVASFAQWLKVGITPRTGSDLDSYVANWIIPFPSQLETWATIAGRASVSCRLYDEDRPALLVRFLETVYPPAALAVQDELSIEEMQLVNRSPTASELRLLCRLNEEPDAASLCHWLTEGVMNEPPKVPEAPVVSEAAFVAFEANNAERVKALNEKWLLPAGREQLRLTSGWVRVGPSRSAHVEEAFALCFINTVRRMEQEQHALRADIKRLRERHEMMFGTRS